MDITSIFLSLGALSGAILVVSEFFAKWTKADGTWAVVQTWVVGAGLAALGTLFKLGIFAEASFITIVITTVLANLVASGAFGLPIAQAILELLKLRFRISTKVAEVKPEELNLTSKPAKKSK